MPIVDDDTKKDDTMEGLQTRLITEDTLSNALLVQQDEESQPAATVSTLTASLPPRHGGANNLPQPDHEVFDQVTRGEKQPNQYRDAPFAILFLLHVLAVSYFAFAWGFPALSKAAAASDNDNDTIPSTNSIGGLLGLCFLSTLASLGILSGTLALMIRHAAILIQASLISSIVSCGVFAILFAAAKLIWVAVLYVLLGALSAWYAWCVWPRIPFAKANLVTATTAIRTNLGIVAVAFGLVVASIIWSFLWMLSYGGIYLHTRHCTNDGNGGGPDDHEDCDEGAVGQVVGILYLLSFYWTAQVIKNILVVTVAGVVGTWWFAPLEASSFCSTAITDSLRRATSYSLGSICFGSLLMAIIQVLHYLIHQARRQGRSNQLLMCILECLINCLENIAEYFNKFAYIYTGLYGYDYLTAGKKVLQLFRQRGWTTIINDQLIYRVLNLMTLVVAGLTGCVGLAVAYLIPSWVESLEDAKYVLAFLLPFLIGAALAHVVLGVVASATDTVIVCFAESPNEFQANYPQLSQDMLNAWRQIYPNSIGSGLGGL